MTAKIIDGIEVSAAIRADLHERVTILADRGVVPGLAVIKVGVDPASAVYVRNKVRACKEVGIQSHQYDFEADVTQQTVLDLIADLNEHADIHGILVQLPLP